MKLVALGTYDLGKPRIRILLRGLKENGVEVITCHEPVWEGVEDKSQLSGFNNKLNVLVKFVFAYPKLIWRYLHLPKHDVVLFGYLGVFDLLVLWPFVKLRRVPIVWDVFISLYNTVVEDRQMVSKYNPVAWLLYMMEWTGLRIADQSIIDTEAHAQYLRDTYNCKNETVQPVFVGAEPEAFENNEKSLKKINISEPFRVVFYGQFIPLHGINTIVQAARLSEGQNIEWLLIGREQEADKIRMQIEKTSLKNLQWIKWVKYEELVSYLMNSHVALGIFGDTDKAARVIPNKVFQILSANRPLITRDSPAIRELINADDPYSLLVPASDSDALVMAVSRMRTTLIEKGFPIGVSPYAESISPKHCGQQLVNVLDNLLSEVK